MAADEHLGLILASFPFSSAICLMVEDKSPNLQKSFKSFQLSISITCTPNCSARARMVSLY
jgi:hypothetical protein